MQFSPTHLSIPTPISLARVSQADVVPILDSEFSNPRIPSTFPLYSKSIPSTSQHSGSPLAGASHHPSRAGNHGQSDALNHSPVSDRSQKSGGILNGLDSPPSSSPAVSFAGSSDECSPCHQRSKDPFDSDRAGVRHQDELQNLPESSSPVRPFLSPRTSSSSSLASSIQTVIHINSPSSVHRTSTATAQGVFLESESESAQVLSDIASKASTAEDQPLGTELAPDENSPRIQFHDTVRIAGGIASKPKHEKAAPNQPKEPRPANRHRRQSVDQLEHEASPNSPLRYSLGYDRPSEDHRKRLGSSATLACSGRARHDQSTSRSAADSSSPSSRYKPTSRVAPKPPSTRSSASHSHSRPRSSPPSSPHNLMNPRLSRLGSGASFARRPSLSDSIMGSGIPSTLVSRSTSPASSIYVPLRVPLVRAPAPSYGPTPERVARVRERRRVAERDAERRKGGWKALWNNWVYSSDERTARKGKARQPAPNPDGHDHTHAHAHDEAQSDSDDDSCYHDILLEHERNKLERKLRKLARVARTRNAQPPVRGEGAQRWLGWLRGSSPARSVPAVAQTKPPTPGMSILRNKTSPVTGVDWRDRADVRTPLLSSAQDQRGYKTGELEADESAAMFGEGLQRWLSPRWWTWKLRGALKRWWWRIRDKFVALFYVEWETEGRYEGWENA